jgi:hypothetical protein
MKNSESKTIEVEGVILTPQCIEQLKEFQAENNETIKQFKEFMSLAIGFILQQTENCGTIEWQIESKLLATQLTYYREYLNNLKAK